VSEQTNDWAVLDELLGMETVPALDNGLGALTFYGSGALCVSGRVLGVSAGVVGGLEAMIAVV
jgi:hypothetical protein